MEKVLVPEYMENFRCTGSECSESCCKKWNINIDKNTYEKYMKTIPTASENIEMNVPEKRTEYSYGHIKMNEEKLCPFLDEKGWCTIHSNYGEEFLSDTCRAFPRTYNIVDGKIELTGSFSCPEIVIQAMRSDEKIIVKEHPMEKIIKGIIPIHIKSDKNSGKWISKYLTEIRKLALEIMQNREMEIIDRFILLGLFLENISKCVLDKQEKKITEIIEQYRKMGREKSIAETTKELKRNIKLQFALLKEFCDLKAANDSEYRMWYTELLQGIEFDEKERLDANSEKYQKVYFTKWRKESKKYDIILEKFMTNYILKNVFPYEEEGNIMKKHILFVTLYALLKFHIIGTVGLYEKINDELIAEVLVKFSRTIEHDANFLENIHYILNNKAYASNAYMFILLKN